MNAASPICDTVWPTQRKRKSRCRSAVEDAQSRRGAHRRKAILRPCRIEIRVARVQMTSRADKAANLETAERLVAQAAATGADVVVLPGEVERDRRRRPSTTTRPSRSKEASPSRPCPAGHARTGSRSSAARSPSGAKDARSSRTRASSSTPRGSSSRSTARSISSTSRSAVSSTASPRRRSRATSRSSPTPRTGRSGSPICYDVRFPELYRILTLEGAQLVTVPAHFTTPTGKDHWHVLLRARAIENQLYVVAAAQIGETLPGQARLRPLAHRRPVGRRARAGAGRGDRDHRRARSGAPARTFARSCRRSRTGSRTRTGGRRGSDARRLARARPRPRCRMRRGVGAAAGRALSRPVPRATPFARSFRTVRPPCSR